MNLIFCCVCVIFVGGVTNKNTVALRARFIATDVGVNVSVKRNTTFDVITPFSTATPHPSR